ncbi:penicillin-binding protein activator [Vibrio sp. SCSIO 43137]|uniref:penicillin-binding protein activator n=1 Tax=Vibrio sp. SCSIO 43137 TaxID=3021011 RepID=UPI002307D874|nr:penicillin-binding protein activator [Vibrio sp. SCSIO 43137]WCE29275.1 penicillin-binding protein activator [Vibrio sp. SCSIO 43137]
MARINHKRISVPRILTPIAIAITLAACTSKPQAPESIDITSEPTQTAQSYLMKADSIQGNIQNDWLIMALKAAIDENNTSQASLLIQRIGNLPLSEVQQAEWQLQRAEYLNMIERPDEALKELYFPQWWQIPDEQWKDYHQLKSELYTNLADSFNASRELIQLSQYVPESQREAITADIWAKLSKYSRFEIPELAAEDGENELAAWLQLAVYMKTLDGNVPQLKSALEGWLQEYPYHPAAIYVPSEIQEILDLEIVEPKSTALLLPLSGKYEKQAKLIRDGFLLALMDDSNREEDATLTIIDTSDAGKEQLIAELQNSNIDFIVGPLVKDKIELVQEIQTEQQLNIPMLALNFPDQIDSSMNTCYLTLSPEQEVEQAAKHLFAEGYQYPLIMAPKGVLGERVAIAFQNEWKKYSRNMAAVSYFGSKSQLQQNVNTVFGINDSQTRNAQMDQLLGMELENQPRSRRDIDAVYIVAKSSELTLIKPFIEVAINPEAKPPKLFANSRSNTGTKRQFEDLSSVIFSDIPLLNQPNSRLDSQIKALWPDHGNGEKRLQALGMDAYHLKNELPQMKVVPEHKVEGQTGTLSLNNQCIVQREISWAEHEAP